jgi:hypothetical protein
VLRNCTFTSLLRFILFGYGVPALEMAESLELENMISYLCYVAYSMKTQFPLIIALRSFELKACEGKS